MTRAINNPRTSDALSRRQRRGLALATAKHQRFRRITEDTWLVPSATRASLAYVVDASRATCTCPDFVENVEMCKHLWAVAYVQNEITLIDGTQLAPPPVAIANDSETAETAETTSGVQGAS